MKTLVLKNTIAVLPDKKVENVSILIEDGKITAISDKEIKADEAFDLSNLTLFAGFIDVHIHGAVGIDVNDANTDDLHEASKFLAKNGVTAWLPTLVPDSDENYQKSIAAIDELIKTQTEREPAARILGVHYEGPFVSEKQCGALRTRFFRNFKSGKVSLPKLAAPEAIHLITVAPEIENGIELIKDLKKQNWIVAIGHTRAEKEILDAAFAAGARHLTHFFNAMIGLHHRDMGVVGWGFTKPETTFDIIADGIHVAPPILKFACRSKLPEKVVLISDSVSPTGLGDGEFEIWGEKVSVTNGKTQNERGNIAGSVITMHDALKRMLSLGFSEMEVSQMASANPARLLGIEEAQGSIAVGKRADLVAIDELGNVRLTLIGEC